MLNYINPFTYPFIELIDNDGTYIDAGGGLFYNWRLIPASYEDEGETQYLMGYHEQLQLPINNIASQLNLMYYYLDYSYFNAPVSHMVPSGDCYWYWERPLPENQSIGALRQYTGTRPSDLDYYYVQFNRPSGQNYYQVTEWLTGWTLIIDHNGQQRVINEYTITQVGVESLRIYYNDTIVGCYSIYGGTNQVALNTAGQSYYDKGYSEGLAEANASITPFTYISEAGQAIGRMFSFNVLPGISVGTLIAIPLVASIMMMLIKLLRK